MKLEKEHKRRTIRSNYFSVRTVNAWNELPERVVEAETVNEFKAELDKFWKDMPTIYNPQRYNTNTD